MSNADNVSHYDPPSKRSKLPSINPRTLEVTTEDPKSTRIGTNDKNSVLNLAQYTKLKSRKASEQKNPIFDPSEAYSVSGVNQDR